jgi:hypothetical protein
VVGEELLAARPTNLFGLKLTQRLLSTFDDFILGGTASYSSANVLCVDGEARSYTAVAKVCLALAIAIELCSIDNLDASCFKYIEELLNGRRVTESAVICAWCL